jgi:uncharacterized membrane protein
MNYLMLVLRLTHIFAGIFWVGATLTTTFYLRPTSEATGDYGQNVLQHLTRNARLFTVMTAAGILTVLAGYSMYWLDSDGFRSAWTHSGPGIGFAIGGAAGLFGLIFRVMANRNLAKLRSLDAELKKHSLNDAPQKLPTLLKTQVRLDRLNTWSLIIAVFFMATARYLVF